MIKIIVENPQSHTSKELRHVIHYLSCIASDIESRTGEGLSVGYQGTVKSDQVFEVTRVEGQHGAELHFPPAGTSPAPADVVELRQEIQAGLEAMAAHVTTLAEDVATAEAATVITQETLPPVEYETVVVGTERKPFYVGHLALYELEALQESGWTTEALLAEGYLREVTEQRPLPVAPSASAAPSAPAPATGTVPAPSAPSSSAAVEVDKDGLPWDARIHSNAEVRKAATGKWKRRKNLTDEYVAEIEAQLRELMAVPVTGNAPALAAPAPTAPAPVTDTTATAAATPPAPAAPPAPVAAPAAPAPAVPGAAPSTFAELTKWLMGHINSKNLEQSSVQVALREIGLKSLPDLNTRPDLIPVFIAKIEADYL